MRFANFMARRSSKKDYDVDVLLVHGIGRSRPGDTLVRFGEAIANWIDDWSSDKGQPKSPAPSRAFRNVRVGEVRFRGQPEDPAAPAHAEVNLANVIKLSPAASGPSKWLLAESWWAETFSTPRYADIASWALAVLPRTVIAHFERRLRRTGFLTRHDTYSLWQWIIRGLHWSLNLFWLVVALFMVPVAVLLILGLLIVGVLPIPAVRAFVAKIQRGLATTIGDSFVLLGSPFASSAIVSKVRRDLTWLAERCEHIAVFAHSQGAAIASQSKKTYGP